MNLIIENNTNLVIFSTTNEISVLNSHYAVGGISVGYAVDGAYTIENAEPPQFYYDNCYSYVDGVWTIVDQQIYDANYQQAYNAAAKPIIEKRDGLLYASDWTQIPNNPLTPTQQQSWTVYRQELRDITKQTNYPWNVVFPNKPAV